MPHCALRAWFFAATTEEIADRQIVAAEFLRWSASSRPFTAMQRDPAFSPRLVADYILVRPMQAK